MKAETKTEGRKRQRREEGGRRELEQRTKCALLGLARRKGRKSHTFEVCLSHF